MATIRGLGDAAELLESSGYEVEFVDGTIRLKVGGMDEPFLAVITADDAGSQLAISCQLAKWGDIAEDRLLDFAVACLDANTRIRPFAFATITASDEPGLDDDDEWPIVLTNSVPLGDLSPDELQAAMDSLWAALASSRDALRVGMKT